VGLKSKLCREKQKTVCKRKKKNYFYFNLQDIFKRQLFAGRKTMNQSFYFFKETLFPIVSVHLSCHRFIHWFNHYLGNYLFGRFFVFLSSGHQQLQTIFEKTKVYYSNSIYYTTFIKTLLKF
jgi:hypothetical protein